MVEEKTVSEAQDYNELIRVTVIAGERKVAVAGTGIGPNRVPHLVEVQGRRLTVELEPNVTVFRYADLPGMIGRVGTIFGTPRHQHLLGRGRAHARRGSRDRAPTPTRPARISAWRRWSSRPTLRCRPRSSMRSLPQRDLSGVGP